jgi:hypothetical protein
MEENKDFYIENGYYVFTEQYHLKRGYCCKSGCRHCPWAYKKHVLSKEQKQSEENSNKNKK